MKTIAHFTDVHLDEPMPEGVQLDADLNLQLVLADLMRRAVDEIVVGGDIGSKSSHDRFFRALAETGKPLRLVLGNHDVVAEVREHYHRAATNDGLYEASNDHVPFRTLFLDSSAGEIEASQLAWLDQELNNSREVLVFIHHPILAVETAIDDLYPLKARHVIRDRLFLHPHPVVVFCGHYHMTDERSEKNVRQFITPAVSFQVRKENRQTLQCHDECFGYRIIRVGEASCESEVIMFDTCPSNRMSSRREEAGSAVSDPR